MNYYFCNNDKHTKQVYTDKNNPECSLCERVMTRGNFTYAYTNFTKIKPGVQKALDGLLYQRIEPFIIQYQDAHYAGY